MNCPFSSEFALSYTIVGDDLTTATQAVVGKTAESIFRWLAMLPPSRVLVGVKLNPKVALQQKIVLVANMRYIDLRQPAHNLQVYHLHKD
jgi:hypothetical protein